MVGWRVEPSLRTIGFRMQNIYYNIMTYDSYDMNRTRYIIMLRNNRTCFVFERLVILVGLKTAVEYRKL